MNVSAILQMLADDPTVLDDPSAFMKRMNAQDQQQMVSAAVVVQEAVLKTTSIAEMNGGLCTQADIDAVLAYQKQKPLQDKADAVKAQIDAAIASGDVKDAAALAQKLTDAAADVVKPDVPNDVPPDVSPVVVVTP